MKTNLLKGTRIWLGNHSAILTQDSTEVDLENVVGVDAVAEVLAGNVQNYGINIAALAHDEDGFDAEGNPTKIHVSYGVGGARIETHPDDFVDHTEIQKKNVAEADAAAEKVRNEETSSLIPVEAVKTADVSDGIRIPDGEGGFKDQSKGDMHERLVTEMVNAPRQFISTGEITPGSRNAFDPPPTTETALAASDSLKGADTSTDPAKDAPVLNGPLPDSFPGRVKLADAGINTYAQARKAEDGLEQIEGIGPQTATQIRAALAGEEV